MQVNRMLCWAALALAFTSSMPVYAGDLLGLYAGAAVGAADVHFDQTAAGDPVEGFDKHPLAWKLAAGIRPISLLGAKIEYVDLGHPSGDVGDPFLGPQRPHLDEHLRGVAAFAVGYPPIHLPFIDPFVKAGLARMHSNVSDSYNGTVIDITPCSAGALSCGGGRYDRAETHVAWGAGIQLRLPLTNLRANAEYERFLADDAHQSLVSVGLSWSF